jgi:anti-sigma B factor antagonist
MDISITEQVVRIANISLRGRIDTFNASALREHMDRLLDDGVVHYVVDLTDVSFLDSAGMAALVSLLKRARGSGGDVKLALPREEAARRILHFTHFDRIFEIVEMPQAA